MLQTVNNQGLGKCYQPRPLIITSTLIIPEFTSNKLKKNCLISYLNTLINGVECVHNLEHSY